MVINDNSEVLVSTDGKLSKIDSYILFSFEPGDIDILANASLIQRYIAAMTMWDFFIKDAAQYSDQDLFEICKECDIEYDNLIDLVRESRQHG